MKFDVNRTDDGEMERRISPAQCKQQHQHQASALNDALRGPAEAAATRSSCGGAMTMTMTRADASARDIKFTVLKFTVLKFTVLKSEHLLSSGC